MTGSVIEKRLWLLAMFLILVSYQPLAFADDDDEEEEAVELVFSAAERAELGITVDDVQTQILKPVVRAPG